MAEKGYWYLTYPREEKLCNHQGTGRLVMWPPRQEKRDDIPGLYDLYLTELCSACGHSDERLFGVMSQGSSV